MFPVRKTIRVVSVVSVLLYLAVGIFILNAGLSFEMLLNATMTANFIFLTYPLSQESPVPSLISAAVVMLVSVAFSLRGVPAAIPSVPLVCVYLAFRTKERASEMKRLFRNDVPWFYMESCSGFVVTVAVFSLGVWYGTGFFLPLAVVSVLMLIVQYYCAFTGHLVVLSRTREDTLKNLIKGDLRSVAAASCYDDTRMNVLYAKVISYMEEKKPYLQEDFSLGEFSRILFTNKSYLSRVINYYSGRNFKQFINYYRVMYSVDLIKKDPRLTVMELASMSGFHSVVTYNVAFRINMNDTPGSYSKCLPRD